MQETQNDKQILKSIKSFLQDFQVGTCIPKCQELRLLFSSGEWIGVKEQNSFSCFCAKPYPVIGFLRRKSNRSIVLSPSIFSYFFQQHRLFPVIQIKDLRISFSGFYLQFESHNCTLIRQSVPKRYAPGIRSPDA